MANACLPVAAGFLAEAIGLPDGTVVLGAHWNPVRGTVDLVISNDDLGVREAGWSGLPEVTIRYEQVLVSPEPSDLTWDLYASWSPASFMPSNRWLVGRRGMTLEKERRSCRTGSAT